MVEDLPLTSMLFSVITQDGAKTQINEKFILIPQVQNVNTLQHSGEYSTPGYVPVCSNRTAD